jgi:hypothetical protein
VFEINFKKGISVSSFPLERAPTNGNAGLHSKECCGSKEEDNLKRIAPEIDKPVNQSPKMKAAWQKKGEPFSS